MTPVVINHLAIGQLSGSRPGTYQDPGIFHDSERLQQRERQQEWKVPLGIGLPVTMLVSLGIWAGIGYAVKSLFF